MKIILFLISILISITVLGQQDEALFVKVSKSEMEGDYSNYDIKVQNKSDSIICILHSIFMNLTTDSSQGLAVYIKKKEREEYSLHLTFDDTTYISEVMPRKGEFILPHQNLTFKIKILRSIDNIPSYLTLQYFYLADMCYGDFKTAMKEKVGSWYYKYNRLKKSVKLEMLKPFN